MKDFFISYNNADSQWAEWIAWSLEEAGYTTIIQAWDFRPGSNFVLNMQQAAIEANRTIAVISENYLNSLFTQPEWAAAFAQNPTSDQAKLIPVRIQQCELKGLLAPIVYIDLVGVGKGRLKEVLLAGVHQALRPDVNPRPGKPVSPPSLPGMSQAGQMVYEKSQFPDRNLPVACGSSTFTSPPASPPSDRMALLREELDKLIEIDDELKNNRGDTLMAATKLRDWKKRVTAVLKSDDVYKIEPDEDRKGKGVYGELRNTIKKCRRFMEQLLN